jgi:periplasmic protein CpxP/Spy
MDTKKRFYWLWAGIGLLLCLNIATIGWAVSKWNSVRANRQNTDEIIIRRLDFTSQQIAQYHQSRSQMQTKIKPYEDSLQMLRTNLFNQIRQPIKSDSTVNQLLEQIARQNTAITRLRFRHWQRVRALGTPDQQTRFDQLLTRFERVLNSPGQAGGLRGQLRNQR